MNKKICLAIAVQALLITSCNRTSVIDEQVNVKASIPGDFNFKKQGFKVVSLLIDKKAATISTMYGNDVAIESLKKGNLQQSSGMVIFLITWKQRSNPYWYGNNIPGPLTSVEMLTTDRETKKVKYRLFKGSNLILTPNETQAEPRINFILAQKPSILP